MQLLIDSSDPGEIETAVSWGIIDGVTTNPTLIAKSGPDMKKALKRVISASLWIPHQDRCRRPFSPRVRRLRRGRRGHVHHAFRVLEVPLRTCLHRQTHERFP